MREPVLNQKTRFVLLLLDLFILCVASWFVFDRAFPPSGDKGFWFYTALLGLLLGSRLDTPFFAKPADVVLYAAPAAVSLLLINAWGQWGMVFGLHIVLRWHIVFLLDCLGQWQS